MSKQPPSAPTASTEGPCPTLIQISRTPRHCKFAQHTIAPPDHPWEEIRDKRKQKLTRVPGESEEIAQEGQAREIRKDIERREEQETEKQAERGKIIRDKEGWKV